MKSRIFRAALGSAALVLAGVLPVIAQAETRGVVDRIDVPSATVYFTDGRSVGLAPGSRLTVDGRPVDLADVKPGWTLVVPAPGSTNVVVTAPSAPAATPPPATAPAPSAPTTAAASTPATAAPDRSPVDVTGVVSRVDTQRGTVTLDDGRVLQATGRSTVWQLVQVRDLKPGSLVYLRNAAPVDFRPPAEVPARDARVTEGDRPKRSIGQKIDDAAIVAEVMARLTADKFSNLAKIDVKSDAGVVTLAGTVDSAERRARAAQIASSVSGVKTVLNNIDVTGVASAAAGPPASPAGAPVEVTGTVAAVDTAAGTITLQDGRVMQATDQTVVWQPSTVAGLRPGSRVLLRGATPVAAGTGSRHWRMATISRVNRSAGELVLSDGSTVKVTPATDVHRGAQRLGVDALESGTEVVVYTPSASATEASEVAVVWMPTASVK